MISYSDNPDQPADLATGFAVIDEEHRRLRGFVRTLRTICEHFDSKTSCESCSPDKIAGCERALTECVIELLNYMVEHFRYEEKLMKDLGLSTRQHERYLLHAEDHADIADRVALLTLPNDGLSVVRSVAETATILSSWLDQHIARHDVPMLH